MHLYRSLCIFGLQSLHRVICVRIAFGHHHFTASPSTVMTASYTSSFTASHFRRPCHFVASAATTSLHHIGCDHIISSHRLRPRHFVVSAAGMSSLHRLRLLSDHRLSITPSTAAVFTSSISTLHRERLPFLLGTITSTSAMTSCDTFFALSLGIRHHITPITFARVLCHLLSGQAGLGFSCWLAEQLVYSPLANIQNHLQIS